jgi:Cys-tRNA(Pro) deacylase
MADKHPVTQAVRVLRAANVVFEPLLYTWVEKGGTAHSAEALGVDEHTVVKTLVMERDDKSPLIVLMHGDRQVSTKELARQIGARSVQPCDPAVAEKHSGYKVGGTSPFGTRKAMPVYVERTILDLDEVHLNGGGRGFLVRIAPRVLVDVLHATPVDVAT